MASIAQLVSEIAHSVNQADSIPVRRAIKLSIIHARNELIRKSFNNHSISDKGLQQRVRLELINVPDGDLVGTDRFNIDKIKRTKHKVPRPVRLINNLPFHSVRTVGMNNPIEIAWVKEASAKYYKSLPGFCSTPTYDYINEYIYISADKTETISGIGSIVVESIFEYPHLIETETVDGKIDIDKVSDDDEFLLPEDMIGAVKKLVLETFIPEIIKDTNEISNDQLIR